MAALGWLKGLPYICDMNDRMGLNPIGLHVHQHLGLCLSRIHTSTKGNL